MCKFNTCDNYIFKSVGKICEYTVFVCYIGNLDSKTSDEVIALLKMTAKKYGQTIVMITHDDEIAQVADRILVIEDGQVVDFR